MAKMAPGISREDTRVLFDEVDLDGSGDIDFDEFLVLVARYGRGAP